MNEALSTAVAALSGEAESPNLRSRDHVLTGAASFIVGGLSSADGGTRYYLPSARRLGTLLSPVIFEDHVNWKSRTYRRGSHDPITDGEIADLIKAAVSTLPDSDDLVSNLVGVKVALEVGHPPPMYWQHAARCARYALPRANPHPETVERVQRRPGKSPAEHARAFRERQRDAEAAAARWLLVMVTGVSAADLAEHGLAPLPARPTFAEVHAAVAAFHTVVAAMDDPYEEEGWCNIPEPFLLPRRRVLSAVLAEQWGRPKKARGIYRYTPADADAATHEGDET